MTAVKLTRDSWAPYEGTVVRIETHWTDRIAFEFDAWEHLIIETPENRTIDRLISLERRLSNRIEAGDYVFKKRGFGNAARPRDKKTSQELREDWERRSSEKQPLF